MVVIWWRVTKTAGVPASRLPPLCSQSWYKQYNCCPRYNVYPLAWNMDVGDRAPVIAVGIRTRNPCRLSSAMSSGEVSGKIATPFTAAKDFCHSIPIDF